MYDIIFFTDIPSVMEVPSGRGYGAYRLASDLRDKGYSVLTVDFSSALTFEDYKEILDIAMGDNTIAVGFSTTWFPFRPNVKYSEPQMALKKEDWLTNGISYQFSFDPSKFAHYVKKVNRNTKVIVGGAKSYEYKNELSIDNVFIGFAENTIFDFLNSIAAPRVFDYDKKATNGKFDFNTSTTRYVETDCIHGDEILNFEFSRGCIFNCAFCSYPHRNQKTKNFTKYQDVIYQELLENYEKWGTTSYRVTDDTFNDYTEKLQVINEVVQDLPFQPSFWSYIRQDLCGIHPEQIKLLYDIGVRESFYGMETWTEETAKIIRKGGKLENKIQALKMCKDYWGDDVWTTASFVIGLPEDNQKDWYAFADWYEKEGHRYIDFASLNSLILRDYGEYGQFIFQSDIELDPKKYGYEMDSFITWTRSTGDINSSAIADEVRANVNKQIDHVNRNKNRPNKQLYNPVKIYKTLMPGVPIADAYYQLVHNFYKPSLLEKIKNVRL